MTALLVTAGALVGAPARFLLDAWVQRRLDRVFPWGTLVVNVSGSFALGLLTGAALAGRVGSGWVAALGIGFCGTYTTFSTTAYESVRLAEEGARLDAAANVVGTAAACLAAAGAGLTLGGA